MFKNVKFILTDIEGTTTSISFVADELFPYFRENINNLIDLTHISTVKEAFDDTIKLALEIDDELISTDTEIIAKLHQWSVEDRKITPLKAVQGVIWEQGYRDGSLKGHVYDEVAENLKNWTENGIRCGVFSSGSVPAQKLIFGYSISGDLTKYFSAYFDTKTGGKRETETYVKIATELKLNPRNILFLSDIVEELESAKEAGYQTCQLVRPGNIKNWDKFAENFNEIQLAKD